MLSDLTTIAASTTTDLSHLYKHEVEGDQGLQHGLYPGLFFARLDLV